MPVNEKLMELGSWSFELIDETPKTVLDQIGYFGHVAFIPGRVEPGQYGDELLDMARYVGVVTGKSVDHLRKVISGQSMNLWLADSDGKGDLLETPVVITNKTFPEAIRAILGSGTAVVEGTLYSGVAGTYTGTHVYQSRRKAIDFIATTMGGEYRVNGDGTLDAGPATSLYAATPDTVIVKRRPNRHTDGDDLTMHGLRGDMGVASDVKDWTSRVVLLAEGEGNAIATASANNPANPYLDLRGQPVKRVRVISESTTAPGNAQARANMQLGKYVEPRHALTLTTDDYDTEGAFNVGDWAWIYDPDAGLVDTQNEITFRGERLNPVKMRMVGASWPIRPGTTVAYRAQDGSWLDLTPYVAREGGETTVTVGDLLRALSDSSVEPVGPRPIPDSTVPGVVSWDLPFESGVYLGSSGETRAKMLVKWQLPLNTDGSTILDGHHYEIQYGVSPVLPAEWQTAYAPWGDLQAMIYDLTPGTDYDFRIRAVDAATPPNVGEWSVTETAQANPDTIPPSTPAPPTVAGNRLSIQITHTLGKASGGTFNLELDLDHFEVHVGDSNSYTADETTLKGKVAATGGMIVAEIPAVGTVPCEETTTRYVRVIAVDQAGNRSDPSATATVTALLVDSAHISDLTASKITAGTLSANILLGASIRTASSGQRVELNASGLHGFNGSGVELVTLSNTGSFTLRTAASGSRVQLDGTGFKAFNSGGQQTVDIAASTGSVTVVGQISTGFSGRRVVLDPSDNDIKLYPATGSNYAFIREYPVHGSYASIGLNSAQMGTPGVNLQDSSLVLQPDHVALAVTKFSRPGGLVGRIIISDFFDEFFLEGTVGGSTNRLECTAAGWRHNGNLIKSFIIPHPDDPDRWLIHGCTESPHNGVEYWGTATLDDRGHADIELPGYFESLTARDGRAVLLTGMGHHIIPPTATYPEHGRFLIHGVPGQQVSWLVKAIRKDVPPVLVEPRRDDVIVQGDGPYRYYTLKESRVPA